MLGFGGGLGFRVLGVKAPFPHVFISDPSDPTFTGYIYMKGFSVTAERLESLLTLTIHIYLLHPGTK